MGKKPVVSTLSPTTDAAVVDDAVLDTLAAELAGLHRSTTLQFALATGRLVIDRLYGGSLARWRAGDGAKDGSLRKLAAKLEALNVRGLSAGALQQACATLDLERRAGVTGRPQLTASHVRAVIGLPDAKQEQLLGTSEAKDWTAARLAKEADKARAKLATRPGRPPLPAFVRTVNRWERELADPKSFFGDLDRASALPTTEAARVRAAVVTMRNQCEALLAVLP